MSLTTSDIDSIAQHVKASLATAGAAADAAATEASGLQNEFCKNWPTIRQGLTILLQLLALVPAIGGVAKVAINLVIGIGDAVQKAVCPGTTTATP